MPDSRQQRAERRRGLILLGICAPAALGLLGWALVPVFSGSEDDPPPAGVGIGVPAAQAGCLPEISEPANGNNEHVSAGTDLDYPTSPPAAGPHWEVFAVDEQRRNFHTPRDRPAVEQLVHSLEHGHTLIWYDDTISEGTRDHRALRQLARAYRDEPFVNVVPWTSADGGPFPDGKHVALTHWTGPEEQRGVRLYCSRPSAEVVADFVAAYPKTDAAEYVPRG